ncbi:hypothetical protein DXG01_016644 [Tephrocybe rancida]|nr:hypothetical protein DXG01_016644 [Tephrocybe rancida]
MVNINDHFSNEEGGYQEGPVINIDEDEDSNMQDLDVGETSKPHAQPKSTGKGKGRGKGNSKSSMESQKRKREKAKQMAKEKALYRNCSVLEPSDTSSFGNHASRMEVLTRLVQQCEYWEKSAMLPLKAIARNLGLKHYKNFWEKVHQGTFLAYIAGAGTPHILLLMAVLQIRTKFIYRGQMSIEDLSGIGIALRQPPDVDVGKLVKTILIPFLRCLHTSPIPLLPLLYFHGSQVQLRNITPLEPEALDVILGCASMKYFPLPKRSPLWQYQNQDNLSIALQPVSQVPTTELNKRLRTMKTFKAFPYSACPIPRPSRRSWMAAQRALAMQAPCAKNLAQLSKMLSSRTHTGHGKYIQFDSRICNRNTLLIQDAQSQLLALVITDFPKVYPQYNTELVTTLQALFTNELYKDDSSRDDYTFLSCHYSVYNRYSEQGDNAPTDVHPNNIYKECATHVNHGQRTPHESKEIKRDAGIYNLTAEFLQKLMNYVETNVSMPSFEHFTLLHLFRPESGGLRLDYWNSSGLRADSGWTGRPANFQDFG